MIVDYESWTNDNISHQNLPFLIKRLNITDKQTIYVEGIERRIYNVSIFFID